MDRKSPVPPRRKPIEVVTLSSDSSTDSSTSSNWSSKTSEPETPPALPVFESEPEPPPVNSLAGTGFRNHDYSSRSNKKPNRELLSVALANNIDIEAENDNSWIFTFSHDTTVPRPPSPHYPTTPADALFLIHGIIAVSTTRLPEVVELSSSSDEVVISLPALTEPTPPLAKPPPPLADPPPPIDVSPPPPADPPPPIDVSPPPPADPPPPIDVSPPPPADPPPPIDVSPPPPAEAAPPLTRSAPPPAEAAPPLTRSAPPPAEAAPPLTRSAPPPAEAAPPLTRSAPPPAEAAPPLTRSAPPPAEAAPPLTRSAPPPAEAAPPLTRSAPPPAEAAPPLTRSAPPPAEAAPPPADKSPSPPDMSPSPPSFSPPERTFLSPLSSSPPPLPFIPVGEPPSPSTARPPWSPVPGLLLTSTAQSTFSLGAQLAWMTTTQTASSLNPRADSALNDDQTLSPASRSRSPLSRSTLSPCNFSQDTTPTEFFWNHCLSPEYQSQFPSPSYHSNGQYYQSTPYRNHSPSMAYQNRAQLQPYAMHAYVSNSRYSIHHYRSPNSLYRNLSRFAPDQNPSPFTPYKSSSFTPYQNNAEFGTYQNDSPTESYEMNSPPSPYQNNFQFMNYFNQCPSPSYQQFPSAAYQNHYPSPLYRSQMNLSPCTSSPGRNREVYHSACSYTGAPADTSSSSSSLSPSVPPTSTHPSAMLLEETFPQSSYACAPLLDRAPATYSIASPTASSLYTIASPSSTSTSYQGLARILRSTGTSHQNNDMLPRNTQSRRGMASYRSSRTGGGATNGSTLSTSRIARSLRRSIILRPNLAAMRRLVFMRPPATMPTSNQQAQILYQCTLCGDSFERWTSLTHHIYFHQIGRETLPEEYQSVQEDERPENY